MPGRGSYGPAGKWVYSRAARLRKKNPKMEESTSFAIAVQQAHKVGKSPKSFHTPEGVATAKAKMTNPIKEYRKTAALAGFFDEMDKIASAGGLLRGAAQQVSKVGLIPLAAGAGAAYGVHRLTKKKKPQPQMVQR